MVLVLRVQINLLLNPIINLQMNFTNRSLERRKVYSSFRDNIWGVDLADMQSLGK